MARISAAMERIDAARAEIATGSSAPTSSDKAESNGSARVMALVNAHERLREEVADTIGQIDSLIEELEA